MKTSIYLEVNTPAGLLLYHSLVGLLVGREVVIGKNLEVEHLGADEIHDIRKKEKEWNQGQDQQHLQYEPHGAIIPFVHYKY